MLKLKFNINMKCAKCLCVLFCALGVILMLSVAKAAGVSDIATTHAHDADISKQAVTKKIQTTAQASPVLSKSQPLYWQAMTKSSAAQHFPKHALALGYNDRGGIYVCSAEYKEGLHPGQYTAEGCLISYDGAVIVRPNFKLLVGLKGHFAWYSQESFMKRLTSSTANDWGYMVPGLVRGSIKQNNLPLIGGYEPVTTGYASDRNIMRNLYICRSIIGNRIHIGKVVGNACNIGYRLGEYMLKSFEVLFFQENVSSDPADASAVIYTAPR